LSVTQEELVTRPEIARRLGVTPGRLNRWIIDGRNGFPAPRVRIGKLSAWEWEDVALWARPQDRDARPAAAGAASSSVPPLSRSPTIADPLLPGTDVFIGRGGELGALAEALASSRLIVLTGPSGVGKTRLAREVAARIAGRYPSGAQLVELAALTDPALVPQAVAKALSIWEQPGRAVTETLASRLRRRQMLLLLDNCEHLLQACARLTDTLLRACPQLTILATSQAGFGIAGERVWPLDPLPVPGAGAAADTLASSEAVSLFGARAAGTKPGFSLTPDVTPIVAEICRRLDGMPLAIELAAARVSALTPGEIVDRLDDRFTLLTGGSLAVLPRHQTLRTAIEWSHGLLSRGEAELLARVSVFTGGWTLEAAERVCGEGLARSDVLASLSGLIAKSLVLADTSGRESRYRMLETIRLYGAERLADAGETEAMHARHARWYLAVAKRAEPELTGREQTLWLDRLEADHDNLRAAMSWAVRQGDAESALRLAAALTLFWRIRGYWTEGRERLMAALAVEGAGDARGRAGALWGVGFLAMMLEDHAAALLPLEECLAIARELGDGRLEARTLLLLGNSAGLSNHPVRALETLSQSAELARQVDDSWCLAHALALISRGHLAGGDTEAARAVIEECLDTAHRAQDWQSLRMGLTVSGVIALSQGDYGAAESMLTEGLEASRQLGEPYFTSVLLTLLGDLHSGRGEYPRAREFLQEAAALNGEGVMPSAVCATLSSLGELALGEGDLAQAGDLFAESVSTAGEVGLGHSRALRGLGERALAEGDWQQAATLLGEALTTNPKPDRAIRAAVISSQANLARQEGDMQRAVLLHVEALEIRHHSGYLPDVVTSLEDLGGIAAEAGQFERGTRLLGAAQALRDTLGCVRSPVRQRDHDADVDRARQGLGPRRFGKAWKEGLATHVDEAVSYALRGHGRRAQWKGGWAGLTRAERMVAGLVAEGLTNVEIGKRLFISPRTVETHLTNTFSKLNISTRRQLAAEASRRNATP